MILYKKIIFIYIVFLFIIVPAFAKTAGQLNTEGYRLYKQKRYAQALEKFRKAVEVNDKHALAHYNLACTLGVLRKQGGACDYEASVGTILYHLKKSVQLDPGRAKRMQKDPDFAVVHATVTYQVLSGLDPEKPDDFKKILVRVSWLGPTMGMYGHTSGIYFKTDGTFEFWEHSFDENEEVDRIYCKGIWKVKGIVIELHFKKPRNNKRIYKGKLKGSVLNIEGIFGAFSNEPDECGV